jgi:structural maintenance of chromosome 4
LVQPNDPKFQDAFYFALRNTLVTQNIDQATQIAYNSTRRYRVVTVDGELIELSGTIAGGGKPRSGGMSSKIVQEFSEKDIYESQDELRKRKEEVTKIRQEIEQLSNMYTEINQRKMRA